MSCSSASSPINISKAGTGDCRLKCNYSFNYSPTSLQATNRGDFIRVSMDKSPQPPVVYNTERYNVQEMRIYHPSLHTYGGKHAAGEILIMHNAVSGGSNMIVSIPIVDNGGSSSMMDELITQVARSANTKGGKMNINLPVFSLEKIVPKAPYYNYSGTLPYDPCNGSYEYVVFDLSHPVSLTKASHSRLLKITKAASYGIKQPKDGLFYNSKGVSSLVSQDEIYIECNPTGSDGSTMIKENKKEINMSEAPAWLENLLGSGVLPIILAVIVFIIIMKVFHKAYEMFAEYLSKPAVASSR